MYILLEGRCKTIKENSGQKAPKSLAYPIQTKEEATFNTRQFKAVNSLFSSDKVTV